MAKKYLDKTGLERLWTKLKSLLSNKVDKVNGKGLSTNDFTNEYKTKLDGLNLSSGGLECGQVLAECNTWLAISLPNYARLIFSTIGNRGITSVKICYNNQSTSLITLTDSNNDDNIIVGSVIEKIGNFLSFNTPDGYWFASNNGLIAANTVYIYIEGRSDSSDYIYINYVMGG